MDDREGMDGGGGGGGVALIIGGGVAVVAALFLEGDVERRPDAPVTRGGVGSALGEGGGWG